MTPVEHASVSVELAKTAEVFGEPLSDVKLALYLEALDDLPERAVLWALREARRRLSWWPKPGQVRALLTGTPEDRASVAWGRFLRALERVGTYESVDFADPALHATVEALGGWAEQWRVERLTGKELDWKRAEFLRLYQSFATALPPHVAGVLVGQHEIAGREGPAVAIEGGPWRLGLGPARKELTA